MKALKDAAQLTTEMDAERPKAKIAVAERVQLQDRVEQLEKRVRELEKQLERTKPGADKIDGKITALDKKLVKLNRGSDDGVSKDQVLDVYRTEPKPLYLGRVTVIAVTPKEAVAKPIEALKEAIKVGDMVTTQLVPK